MTACFSSTLQLARSVAHRRFGAPSDLGQVVYIAFKMSYTSQDILTTLAFVVSAGMSLEAHIGLLGNIPSHVRISSAVVLSKDGALGTAW